MPRVSILLPVHNEEKFVKLAIESVLNQTIDDIELIVVDDGSTDNTKDIVSSLASHDTRVKAIFPGKVGKNAAYNIAFGVSSGDLFVFFAGDDVLPANSIEKRIAPLSRMDPKVIKAVSFGHLRTLSEWKKYDGLVLPRSRHKGVRTGGTITFTRGIAEEIFPIPVQFPNEDTWAMLCVDAFAERKFEVEEVVAVYRIHENNSRKRGIEFCMANEEIHKRAMAYDVFIQEKGSLLSERILKNVIKKRDLENLRYNGETLKILLFRGVDVKQKMRAFFHSCKFLYDFKVKYENLFYGR